jgi:hypothetical protein
MGCSGDDFSAEIAKIEDRVSELEDDHVAVPHEAGRVLERRHARQVEFATQRSPMRQDAAGFKHQASNARQDGAPSGIRLPGDEDFTIPHRRQLRRRVDDADRSGDRPRARPDPDQRAGF